MYGEWCDQESGHTDRRYHIHCQFWQSLCIYAARVSLVISVNEFGGGALRTQVGSRYYRHPKLLIGECVSPAESSAFGQLAHTTQSPASLSCSPEWDAVGNPCLNISIRSFSYSCSYFQLALSKEKEKKICSKVD
jgi:hypothetical protein